MKVAALVGPSGAGKTTLLEKLIRRYVAEGKRVGAIKHTHHPLNEEDRGDTAIFRRAGAEPVILAREGEAVVFRRRVRVPETSRITYADARELLALFDVDIVLVEGRVGDWPAVRISPDDRPGLEALAGNLDRIWRS